MGIVTDKNITLFDSLDDISIYRLDKCMQGYYKYLITSYEYGLIDVFPIETKKVWDKLYNEWCELTENLESAQVYALACEINYLRRLIMIVPQLILAYSKNENKEVLEELRFWGFKIDVDKDIFDEIDRMAAQLRATESKLNFKLEEYEELNKGDSKPMTLQHQKVKIERVLGVSIRLKRTSAMEWKAYLDELESLNKKKNE